MSEQQCVGESESLQNATEVVALPVEEGEEENPVWVKENVVKVHIQQGVTEQSRSGSKKGRKRQGERGLTNYLVFRSALNRNCKYL